MRGTPNGLYSHVWIWFEIVFRHARQFGRIGNQDGQSDIRWRSREEVTKRPRYILLGRGERMSPTRNETYVKNGFYGGGIAQAGAHGAKDGVLDGPGGECLAIGFGCHSLQTIYTICALRMAATSGLCSRGGSTRTMWTGCVKNGSRAAATTPPSEAPTTM